MRRGRSRHSSLNLAKRIWFTQTQCLHLFPFLLLLHIPASYSDTTRINVPHYSACSLWSNRWQYSTVHRPLRRTKPTVGMTQIGVLNASRVLPRAFFCISSSSMHNPTSIALATNTSSARHHRRHSLHDLIHHHSASRQRLLLLAIYGELGQ